MLDLKLQALKNSILFSFADAASVSKISRICVLKSFRKNDVLFQEGDRAFGFYIVARGRIKIYKLSFSGDEHILHILSEGGVFAEAVVFSPLEVYPAFAEAVADSEVLFIPKKDFLDLLRHDFSLTLSVFSSMAGKLKSFNTIVEELSLKSADSRLAKYLLDLALKNKSATFSLDTKKIELAKKLGIAAETLSRLLGRLKSRHVLSVSSNKITILKKEVLQVISSGQKLA